VVGGGGNTVMLFMQPEKKQDPLQVICSLKTNGAFGILIFIGTNDSIEMLILHGLYGPMLRASLLPILPENLGRERDTVICNEQKAFELSLVH
jgi:hypothetical protein